MNLNGLNLQASVFTALQEVRGINPFLTEAAIAEQIKELGQQLIDRVEELYGVLDGTE